MGSLRLLVTTSLVWSGSLALARDISPPVPPSGESVQLAVTVIGRQGKPAPEMKQEDFIAFQGKERLQVTSVIAPERAPLELFILIDEASGMSLATQFGDLRQFMQVQPAQTSIGIGYMRNGIVEIVQSPTSDHQLAGKALRLPVDLGGAIASPFLSLSDLLKRWPETAARREVLLISSGIDALGGDITDPYLDAAIEHAQRAGVVVYAIYTPIARHGGYGFSRMNWGQNHLAQITEETGGACYMLGFGPPVSFSPYLSELTNRFAHQYVVTVTAKPGSKAGFQPIRFATEVPNAAVVAASRAYVAAAY